ncbi:S1 family peptidase [Alkalicella caledoniensis]|uniref:S1 family peptidase n=1 Tax=Alkalicella caledoniensis TaxID=2731377 RepID=UPI001FE3BC44|nr:serine protease [Alkalicella caledoniensis]
MTGACSFQHINKIVFPVGRITQNGINLLGTAFMLGAPGYFATASHVTNNDDKNLVIILNKTESFYNYQDTTNKKVNSIPAKIHATDPFCDLSIIKVENGATSNVNISGADECVPGDSVAIFGFPHADQGRMVLTEQRTQIGAKVMIESGGIKTKHIILNVQSRPGQSGGPIIKLSSMEVVGILIGSYAPSSNGGISIGGIDPQTLHQTTHAVSAEYLKEMIYNG